MRNAIQGLVGAALWGLAAEAALLLFHHLTGEAAINRTYRLIRVGEVALWSAAVALLLAVPPLTVGPVRRWVQPDLAALLSAWGLALPIWLFCTFHLVPLDADVVKLTSDPLVLRSAHALVGAVPMMAVPIVVFWLQRRSASTGLIFRGQAVLAVVLCSALWMPSFRADLTHGRPNMFLFSVDTLRADHLGCYGYRERETSAEIDRLCEESIVYEKAIAPAPYTIASYASILSGLLQRDHGVYGNYQKAGDELETLPERLAEYDYRRAAIIDGSFPGTFANLDQGFETVIQRGVVAHSALPSLSENGRSIYYGLLSLAAEFLRLDRSATTEVAERWIREQQADALLFAHFYWPYPHAPYAPPSKHLSGYPLVTPGDLDRDRIRDYDGEIRFTDTQISRVFQVLQDRGLWEDAWIVFTADHGEELGRPVPDGEGGTIRYWGHSRYLYDSSLRVPLVVRPPRELDVPPRRLDAVVTTASIAATLLDAAGVPRPGRLVEPLPLAPDDPYSQPVVSVSRSPVKPVDIVSVRTGEWRLIETRRPEPGLQLYRYDGEEESEDLASSELGRVAELLEKLRSVEPEGPPLYVEDEDLSISDRERERLEALGYLE